VNDSLYDPDDAPLNASSLSRTNSVSDSRMETAAPKFTLRARVTGVLDWLCPWCGHLNRCRVDRTDWRFRCKGKPCRRGFAYGLVLHSLGSLQRSGRTSLPPPDITFPLAELNLEYQLGAPVHRFIAEEDQPA
jgi:hypothetical protein